MAIIVHKCEGRLFLTDRNGYYNDLLLELNKATLGMTMIVLTQNKQKLIDEFNQLITDDISVLACKGDQPTLLNFRDQNLIQVWNKKGPQNLN